MDGRDTPPHSGAELSGAVAAEDAGTSVGKSPASQAATSRWIATIVGNASSAPIARWSTVTRPSAWSTQSPRFAPLRARHYRRIHRADRRSRSPSPGRTGSGEPVATIRDEDSVIFYNFRADRARQMTRALSDRASTNSPIHRVRKIFFSPASRNTTKLSRG